MRGTTDNVIVIMCHVTFLPAFPTVRRFKSNADYGNMRLIHWVVTTLAFLA